MNCRLANAYKQWHRAIELVFIIVIGAASLSLMVGVGFSGDEWSYTYKAQVLASGLKTVGSLADFNEHLSQLIGYGWFMPGISVLLSPLYILMPEAHPPLVRCYMLGLNLFLLGIICRQLSRNYGPYAPIIFLSLCTLTPFYVLQLSSVFAEIPTTHFSLIFLLRLSESLKKKLEPAGALAGFYVGLITLCRPSGLGLIAIVFAQNIIIALKLGRADRAIRSSMLALIVAASTIAPWSTAVSMKFGPTLTITSPAIAGFWVSDDQEYINRAKAATGKEQKYHAVHEYVFSKSISSGTTFRDQARRELHEQGLAHWWREWLSIGTARDSLLEFSGLKDANAWTSRYLASNSQTGSITDGASASLLKTMNELLWPLLLVLGALLFIVPLKPGSNKEAYFSCFHYKALFFLIALQAFFGAAHGRYFAQLVPVIAVGLTSLMVCSRGNIGLPTDWTLRLGQYFAALTGSLLIMLAL